MSDFEKKIKHLLDQQEVDINPDLLWDKYNNRKKKPNRWWLLLLFPLVGGCFIKTYFNIPFSTDRDIAETIVQVKTSQTNHEPNTKTVTASDLTSTKQVKPEIEKNVVIKSTASLTSTSESNAVQSTTVIQEYLTHNNIVATKANHISNSAESSISKAINTIDLDVEKHISHPMNETEVVDQTASVFLSLSEVYHLDILPLDRTGFYKSLSIPAFDTSSWSQPIVEKASFSVGVHSFYQPSSFLSQIHSWCGEEQNASTIRVLPSFDISLRKVVYSNKTLNITGTLGYSFEMTEYRDHMTSSRMERLEDAPLYQAKNKTIYGFAMAEIVTDRDLLEYNTLSSLNTSVQVELRPFDLSNFVISGGPIISVPLHLEGKRRSEDLNDILTLITPDIGLSYSWDTRISMQVPLFEKVLLDGSLGYQVTNRSYMQKRRWIGTPQVQIGLLKEF